MSITKKQISADIKLLLIVTEQCIKIGLPTTLIKLLIAHTE